MRSGVDPAGQGEFVFGYGSLAADYAHDRPVPTRARGPHGFVADLLGFRRRWGVAMDNRRDVPGYKYYTDREGARPPVFVCFLDVVGVPSAEESAVNGVCRPVCASALAALDARERNYVRIDVSDSMSPSSPARGRVWTYVGSDAGRARFARGARAGTAVIAGGYVRAVRAGFRTLGSEEARASQESLDPGGLPVLELERHELP